MVAWGQGGREAGALRAGARLRAALGPRGLWENLALGPGMAQLLPGPHQEGTLMPKYFRSCSRNTNVSTVCGMRRMPAGTRPL